MWPRTDFPDLQQLDRWPNGCVGSDESLVSFDVTSLFTNVPIEEAVGAIRDKLKENEDLVERTPLSSDTVAELSACA